MGAGNSTCCRTKRPTRGTRKPRPRGLLLHPCRQSPAVGHSRHRTVPLVCDRPGAGGVTPVAVLVGGGRCVSGVAGVRVSRQRRARPSRRTTRPARGRPSVRATSSDATSGLLVSVSHVLGAERHLEGGAQPGALVRAAPRVRARTACRSRPAPSGGRSRGRGPAPARTAPAAWPPAGPGARRCRCAAATRRGWRCARRGWPSGRRAGAGPAGPRSSGPRPPRTAIPRRRSGRRRDRSDTPASSATSRAVGRRLPESMRASSASTTAVRVRADRFTRPSVTTVSLTAGRVGVISHAVQWPLGRAFHPD